MLRLNDRLWQKLDDAHRDRNIPKLLSGLAETWDDEAAKSLFWDCLCHQDTCYGATYAAIPHLLKIARSEGNRQQRFEIALFLGYVVLCALEPNPRSSAKSEGKTRPLQGLPVTLDGWDRKLDTFRSLASNLEDPNGISHYERTVLLPHYKQILAIGPVSADELPKIHAIRTEFFASLPKIRTVCERALLENLQDESAVLHLLSGIAAADGLFPLARLLDGGREGEFRCSSCGCRHEYRLFGDRIAIYAGKASATRDDRLLLDFKEHAPSRSDGFMVPAGEGDVSDRRAAALLALASRAPSPEPVLLLRHFLGIFRCGKCGAQGPILAP